MCSSLDEFDTTSRSKRSCDEGKGFEWDFAKEVDMDLADSTISIGLMADEFVRCES
jgi:hypothetical protein